MDKPTFNPSHKEVLDELFEGIPGVSPGKMFGFPAYYVNKKMFACLYEDGVGLKVSEAVAKDLVAKKKATPFQPYGKAVMREWVQIDRKKSAEYAKDMELFKASIEFVRSVKKK